MPFWTVEDACPYKTISNFLMRTTHLRCSFFEKFFPQLYKRPAVGKNRGTDLK